MPYESWDEVNEAIKGIEPQVTLEQANLIAEWADALADEEDGPENPWAVAIAQFKDLYEVQDDAWVKAETVERVALKRLALYAPIMRVDDEERMVYGVATSETPVEDFPGIKIVLSYEATVEAAAAWASWGNIREMHQASAVGVAREITPREEKRDLFVGAHIVDDAAWAKVKAGVYKGYSINANPLDWKEDQGVVRVTAYEIVELSLVDRPHDPQARITVWRGTDMSKAKQSIVRQENVLQDGEAETMERHWVAGGDMYLWVAPKDRDWDLELAHAQILEHAREGDGINWAEYGRAFFLRDIANPESMDSYRLQFADLDEYGELVAVPAAIFMLAQEMNELGLPDALRLSVERRLELYYHNMGRLAPWEILRKLKRRGDESMNALDKLWLELMGEDAELPEDPQEVERILRSKLAPVTEATEEESEPEVEEEEAAVLPMLRGYLKSVEKLQETVQALEVRLTRLEAQPAAVPVQVTGPSEPTVEEQIEELERAVKGKGLPPDNPDVKRLLRLYAQARQQAG
jgi:hypothetical protein